MQYFVIGATGFFGKRLVKACCSDPMRSSTSCFGARARTRSRACATIGAGEERAIAVYGDLTAKAAETVKRLRVASTTSTTRQPSTTSRSTPRRRSR